MCRGLPGVHDRVIIDGCQLAMCLSKAAGVCGSLIIVHKTSGLFCALLTDCACMRHSVVHACLCCFLSPVLLYVEGLLMN
jgi:hypothetical protein